MIIIIVIIMIKTIFNFNSIQLILFLLTNENGQAGYADYDNLTPPSPFI